MNGTPGIARGVRLGHEAWHTDASHHGYIDEHGNRCERLALPAGSSRVVYEADLLLAHPADVLDPYAPVRRRPEIRFFQVPHVRLP